MSAGSEAPARDQPGALMAREIAEQPDVLARILASAPPHIERVAAAINAASPRFVIFAARGTSDHAALYAKYLFEVLLGWPAGLASPSTMTAYGARPDLRDVLFVGVSQSGGSPDLVGSLRTARECGALTVAVTNAPGSPLAEVAELNIDVLAGPERAVAATKSYTAELLALYLLVDAMRGGDGSAASGIVDAAARIVADPGPAHAVATRFLRVERLVVTGRGFGYPTAREAALKLMETSYLAAQAFSGADLLHGPMAMLERDSAVIAIASSGVGGDAITPVIDRLVELGVNLAVVGDAPAGDPSAGDAPASDAPAANISASGIARLPLPPGLPEELAPIAQIIPLQMLARELAVLRGHDPDAPRGLRKITETW